jgi:uncharacterized protein YbbC (DUF1343 family)
MDRDVLRPLTMALNLIAITRHMSGEAWVWNPHFEKLAGGSDLRSALEASTKNVAEITAAWAESISGFIHQREKYLLY